MFIQYEINNKIVKLISEIYAIWGVIENASIVPEREQKLKKIARLRSSIFSTRIEGSKLTLEDGEKIMKGENVKARPRDEIEMKNYLNVIDYIEKKDNSKKITEKDIFEIHKLITKDILEPFLQNQYRDQQNAIYNSDGGIVYMPPEYQDVKKYMDELLNFINKEKEISPLIRAGILHHGFVIIHPFIDGNGRTARSLTQLFLYQNGFNTKKFFSLEEYYDNDLGNYYEALFIGNNFYNSEKKGIENTNFIEYFLKGIYEELNNLKNTIKSIKDDEKIENFLKKTELTNRQLHIAIYIKNNNKVKSTDLEKQYGISIATIKRELHTLIKKGILIKGGNGKNTYYERNVSGIGAE